MSDAVYKMLRSRVYRFENPLIGVRETTHLFPPNSVTSPQIKASNPILLNSRELDWSSVMLTIVANYNPTSGSDVGHPNVILSVSWEMILVILNISGESQNVQGFGKGCSNIAVKERNGQDCLRCSSERRYSHSRVSLAIIEIDTLELKTVLNVFFT